MILSNCYICHDCDKIFDLPNGVLRKVRFGITAEYNLMWCPYCGSENVEDYYDEDYEDYLKSLHFPERKDIYYGNIV